jgi:hypothetical protein
VTGALRTSFQDGALLSRRHRRTIHRHWWRLRARVRRPRSRSSDRGRVRRESPALWWGNRFARSITRAAAPRAARRGRCKLQRADGADLVSMSTRAPARTHLVEAAKHPGGGNWRQRVITLAPDRSADPSGILSAIIEKLARLLLISCRGGTLMATSPRCFFGILFFDPRGHHCRRLWRRRRQQRRVGEGCPPRRGRLPDRLRGRRPRVPWHGFIVHEWGTNTIVVGSDGSSSAG